MANIQGQKKWSDVRLLETHELARGGVNGNLNEQAKALADRTEFLNQEKASKSEIVQGIHEFDTYALFDAAKATLPLNCTVVIGEENTGLGQWGRGNNRWDGSVLKKSAFDPKNLAVAESNNYTDDKFQEQAEDFEANNGEYDVIVLHKDGSISLASKDGRVVAVSLELVEYLKANTAQLKELTVSNVLNLLGTEFKKGVGKEFIAQVNEQGDTIALWDQFGNLWGEGLNFNTAKIGALTVDELKYKGPIKPIIKKYQIILILSEGQSLGKGIQGGVISTSQKYNDVMFYGGCSIVSPTNTENSQFSGLVPLVQASIASSATPDGGLGEIPVQAATEMIHQLLNDKYGDVVFLAASNAVGGKTIDYLSTTAYTNYVEPCLDNALIQAQAASKTVGLPAFFWTQGNSSASDAAYKSKLIALRQKYDTDAKDVFNQTENVRCIMYQFTNSGNVTTNQVAKATYDLLKENTANFTIACPDYHFPYSTDGIHLRAYGYRLLGAYYGLAWKRTVIDGENWKPLYPTELFRQGKLIQIKFHVPHGQLKFETDTGVIRSVTNQGFDVTDSSGTAITIESVTIVGADTVVIKCATEVPAGSVVRYAQKTLKDMNTQNSFSGFDFGVNAAARLLIAGTLRDTQGDDIQFNISESKLPVMYKLHNWCIAFAETLV